MGLKPTYGAVSRYGLVAFGSSLDQIGPVTKDVTDSALVMNAIAGHDARDSTSVPFQPPDYTEALLPDIKGMRIGVPKEYFVDGIGRDVVDVMERALAKLEELGAEVDREVSLPHTKYALAVYYIIAPSEASANLARYDGVKYGYSAQDAEKHVGRNGEDAAAGVWAGGEEADHARDLCAVVGVLRCLLPEGAKGEDTDQAGVRRSV